MDVPASAPSLLLRALAMLARWSLRLLLGAWLLVALAWAAVHLVIVPRVGELRPQLEQLATRATGVPVKVGAVNAYSTGLIPAIELLDVAFADPQGRTALRLPRVVLALSPHSALLLQFDQLFIDAPALDIRRAADGRLFVAGLDMSAGGSADERVLDHLFSQPEFAIRRGTVRWTDEMRGTGPVALSEVDLVLRNRGRRHEMRLDATPPAQWGERFSLLARFEQPLLSMRKGDWRTWDGQAHVAFGHVELAELRRHVDLGVDLQQGRGALRAWVDVQRARVSGITADVVLADVSLRAAPDLAPLELVRLSGRLGGALAPAHRSFFTEQLSFETREGQVWPGGNLRLGLTEAEGGRPAQGELEADQLDLGALAQIGGRLPLGEQALQSLARHEPRGLIRQLKARWSGALNQPQTYQARGRAEKLQLRAVPATAPPGGARPAPAGWPGLSGMDIEFDLSESGGKVALQMRDGSLSFPGVFEEPVLALSRLSGQLSWQVRGPEIQVQGTGFRFANPDAEGEAEFRWKTSDPARSSARSRFPGVLDLSASLPRGDATRVHRYLPLHIPASARHYVRDAVTGGTVADVRIRIQGDLHDLPYDNPRQGEFSITGSARDLTYAFVPRRLQAANGPPWPGLGQLHADLAFERKGMRIVAARAQLSDASALQLSRGEASIADLTADAPVLALGFELRGTLPDLLASAQGSPVAEYVGPALSRAVATGPADLRLRLNLPLANPERVTLQGTLNLPGNDFQLSPDVPRLARARGSVSFTESSFALNGIQGRALGGDLRLEGGSVQPPGLGAAAARALPSVVLRAQGTASAEGLRQASELGIVSRIAQWTQGSAAYSAQFALRAGVPELALSSNLAGLAIQLPAPFAKPADSVLPLRVESALLAESLQAPASGTPRLLDQISVELGRVASVQYVRDLALAEPRALRGAIGIGLGADEAAVMPAQGVSANINMAALDADTWSELLDRLSGPSGAASARPAGTQADAAARSFMPQTLALRARELTVGGRKLHAVVAGGSREGAIWRANVDAQELNGYVEYRPAQGASAGRVYARLSRLTLAAGSTADVEKLLDEQPANIPALDVVVDDLELRGHHLGRVEIDAVNRAASAAGPREWRLNRLDVTTPEASLRATGNWAALNAQAAPRAAGAGAEARRTVMNFRLDIQNSGELLARFGMKDVVRRGKGVMEGQVAWVGSPMSLDYPSMSGQFNVNIETGQFLKADPGLAKLLGVLSLQSLPRRLALDFRDVFSEGFLFDFVRGDVRIERGIAHTNNLQMKGVNAAVLMAGQADLARETQDLQVVVVPEINAGTASLIATAINPAIGLGTFLAQWVLRRPLRDAITQEFHVEGSWQDPRITRVSRRQPAAGSPGEAATAPAPAATTPAPPAGPTAPKAQP